MRSKCAVCLVCLLVAGFAWGNQNLPKVKDLEVKAMDAMAARAINGSYVVSVWSEGRWREAGKLDLGMIPSERALDLAPMLPAAGAARVRIVKRGGGAAHLDSVVLGGSLPIEAVGTDEARTLKKLSAWDNDVLDAGGPGLELTFPAGAPDKSLKLVGRIEAERVGGLPFRFPSENTLRPMTAAANFYNYQLGSTEPPSDRTGSAATIAAVGLREPFFKESSQPASGHPAGQTYGWVSDDGTNLYVVMDFTPDNTWDGDKDYAKVYVRSGRTVRTFKVSVPETKWGLSHFTYTDKVAYEHKVYAFAIPLAELGLRPGQTEVRLAFEAYGTAVESSRHMSMAFDPVNHRHLLVYEYALGGYYRVWGRLFDAEGNIIQVGGEDEFQISPTGAVSLRPSVAFDESSQRYLVVWQVNAATSDVYGRLVDPEGALIGAPINVKATEKVEWGPAVANDPVYHRFFVVWTDERAYTDDIWGRFFAPTGVPIGDEFVVSDRDLNQTWPDMAFDDQAETYLVAFESQTSTGDWRLAEIRGQVVGWDGTILYNPTDENFEISMPAAEARTPCVANDNVNHRFLVVWSDLLEEEEEPAPPAMTAPGGRRTHSGSWSSLLDRLRTGRAPTGILGGPASAPTVQGRSTPGPIVPRTMQPPGFTEFELLYCQLVAPDADLINAGRTSVLGLGDDPPPPSVEMHFFRPAAAFDSNAQLYLVVFSLYAQDASDFPPMYYYNIMGRLLEDDGQPSEDGPVYFFEVSSAQGGQQGFLTRYHQPAVTFNPFCWNFLVAWPSLTSFNSVGSVILGNTDCITYELPTVTTSDVTDVAMSTATGGGHVTADGGAAVTARGVCWDTDGFPDLGDSHTTDGSGLGYFSSSLTGLEPGTTYNVRAYATNSVGTAYGHVKTFTTLKEYTVRFVTDGGGSLDGATVQYVLEGGDCTPVEAAADTGSWFVNWTGTGGFETTGANPLTVTNVRQDMVLTAHFGSLGLQVELLTEQAWIVKRKYARITASVGGLDSSLSVNFTIYRKKGGEPYASLKQFSSSDLQNGSYVYEDKFLDDNTVYKYQVVAYGLGGQELGRTAEVTVQ